jgi:thioredoxin reductase (NADPH)
MYDVLIIGSGPAGLTAAVYACRSNLKVLCFAGGPTPEDSYRLPGGQLMLTTTVENFPGFPDGIMGPSLMTLMRRQAEKFGTEFIDDNVTAIDFSGRPLKIFVGNTIFEGKAVIIATGAKARWLGLANEKRLRGKGVSACATCDGFLFKGKEVVVVGGGDVAMEDSIHLSNMCTKVTVVHRRDKLRASQIMQKRAMKSPKIHWMWDTVVEDILGSAKVEGVRVKNVKTGNVTDLRADGVFMSIGHEPDTAFLRGHVELDARGYVVRKENTMTSVPGIFAAGDVHDHRYRQAVTAAGFGCQAAVDAQKFVESLE